MDKEQNLQFTGGALRQSVMIDELSNGLTVVTDARTDVETAAVGVWVKAGARHETEPQNGVAHMLEHMAFKGTQKRTARDIAVEIEAVGGHLNAYTSREQTAYYARVLSQDVPLSVDIIADILQNSTFLDEELERERAVVIQEIGQTADTPDDIIFDLLQEKAFPSQPMGRSILGTVEHVGSMDRDRLGAFMSDHYSTDRMYLCAAGAVDHTAVVELGRRYFVDSDARPSNVVEPATYGGGEVRLNRELEQVHFALALPGLSYSDDDFYALQVMSTVLGGGMSSRLFQEVREKRGLCYSVFTFSQSFVDSGMFCVYAGTGAEQVSELVPILCDQLMNLTQVANEEEVSRARAQMKASTLMALESSTARAEQLARQIMIYGRPIPISEIVERIDAVDVAAVCKVADRIMKGATPTTAAIGPINGLVGYDEIMKRFS